MIIGCCPGEVRVTTKDQGEAPDMKFLCYADLPNMLYCSETLVWAKRMQW